jgi:hypothetical protein
MTTLHFHYPGDPVTEIEVMTGREFLDRHPGDRIVQFGSPGHLMTRIDLGDEMVCDTCNTEIRPDHRTVHVRDFGRLYCWRCFTRWIRPHLVETNWDWH